MTAKDKAIELVNKFAFKLVDYDFIETITAANQCALVAVDEIISSYSQYSGMHDQEFFDADLVFWEAVKAELTT